MQPTLQFFSYILTCYTLAALFFLPLELTIPPHQLIQRGGIVIAAIGLWPFLIFLGIKDLTALGYSITTVRFIQTIALGLCGGLTILLFLVTLLMCFNVRYFTPEVNLMRLPQIISGGLLTGLSVAILEESFFRGALFTTIRQTNPNNVSAIFWSSLLYATLHFFKPQVILTQPITTYAALHSIVLAVPALLQFKNLDSLTALFCAGILLALIRERTGHLGWTIGIHAGWILIIRITQVYTDVNFNSHWSILIGSYDGIIGWLAAIWLGILVLTVAYWPIKTPHEPLKCTVEIA